MSQTFILTKAKETKGTVRYDTDQSSRGDVPAPSIYIKKPHLPHPYPDQIEVTIKAVE